MTPRFSLHPALAAAFCVTFGAVAEAHVTLPAGGAAAGSTYTAGFRVGHACEGATATTALRVRLPAGFTVLDVPARPGWTITRTADAVEWTADGPATALPGAEKSRFVVQGRLTDAPGTLWFPVLQTCDRGRVDWAQVPRSADEKPATPAARLDVLPPGVAAVDVRGAWARATVPQQRATGVFVELNAPAGARLLGGRSPVAEAVEVHEMRMDGDVMRMRALPDGLALPADAAVALKPGGHHLMLTGLRQGLPAGSTLPLVLDFVDAEGRRGSREVEVPVRAAAPGAAADPHAGHRH